MRSSALYRLGQSAAIAAGLAHDLDVAVQDVAFPRLKALLVARGQRLSGARWIGTAGKVEK